MSDLDNYRVQQEIRRRSSDLGHSTRYSQAVDRYLGAIGYRLDDPVRPAPTPAVSPAAATKVAGTVLVGVDESPTSYVAVDHAAIEAELRGWQLRIMHVQRHGAAGQPGGASLLDRLTDRVHACSPAVPVTSRLAVGSPQALMLIEARHADLLVVGHRHGAAGSAFGLSVGDRVAAQHAGVVLVVRVPGWPVGPEFGKRPIVVGADERTTTPVEFALDEARVRGCDLVMVDARRNGSEADRVETMAGVLVHHRMVTTDAATALVDFSNRAAAVVAGRRSPGANPMTQLGSISRTLVQRAYCPVFLVG